MKRAIAIFLIGVHLMNIIGCYGIFKKLESVYSEQFSDRLDDDEFAGSDAITLRLPLTLPYSNHQDNYERIEGKFEYEGNVYRLVKQKFYNDTLFVVCVKDVMSTEVKDAFNDFTSSLGQHQANGKAANKVINFLVKDFEPAWIVELNNSLFLIGDLQLSRYTFSKKTNTGFSVDQPPKA